MRLIISEGAVQDLKDHAAYIRADNPDAAERFLQAAAQTFELMAQTPFIGRPTFFQQRRLRHLRCWRVRGFENYSIFYRIEKENLDIVRVIHGAMDIERELL